MLNLLPHDGSLNCCRSTAKGRNHNITIASCVLGSNSHYTTLDQAPSTQFSKSVDAEGSVSAKPAAT